MKKVLNAVWGIWCGAGCMITPVWLTLTYFNLSGLIYRYDYSMDEGTALILGTVMLMMWCALVLLPCILFSRMLYVKNRKALLPMIIVGIVLGILCVAMCGWDIVGFWF